MFVHALVHTHGHTHLYVCSNHNLRKQGGLRWAIRRFQENVSGRELEGGKAGESDENSSVIKNVFKNLLCTYSVMNT